MIQYLANHQESLLRTCVDCFNPSYDLYDSYTCTCSIPPIRMLQRPQATFSPFHTLIISQSSRQLNWPVVGLSSLFYIQTTSRMKRTMLRLWTNLAATSSAGTTLTLERPSSSSPPSPRSCRPYWRTWWVQHVNAHTLIMWLKWITCPAECSAFFVCVLLPSHGWRAYFSPSSLL